MNSIVLSIVIMVALSLCRAPVVAALVAAAVIGGLHSGLPLEQVVTAFNEALGGGAPVALAMGTLGAFAAMLSRTGLPQSLAMNVIERLRAQEHGAAGLRAGPPRRSVIALYSALILVGFVSGTIVPVHIAYIPILIPPLLLVMNHLQLDRRAVACVLTFSLGVMYLISPIGYGSIYLYDILLANINDAGEFAGLELDRSMPHKAMLIPVSGMLIGLLTAVLFTYRRSKVYVDKPIDGNEQIVPPAALDRWQIIGIVAALCASLAVQLYSGSMIFGGLVGFALLSCCRIVKWSEQDNVFAQGVRMMAFVGFIMIAASGFAGVMKATGEIPALVQGAVEVIGDSRGLAALVMLLVGLFVTIGIGSSFSTVPLIAAIYVPLCISFGFSPLATLALIGTAGALGDAGSPASDTTLGVTVGLNADNQHDHIWDTVVPTFLHFNIPLMIMGWIAAMVL